MPYTLPQPLYGHLCRFSPDGFPLPPPAAAEEAAAVLVAVPAALALSGGARGGGPGAGLRGGLEPGSVVAASLSEPASSSGLSRLSLQTEGAGSGRYLFSSSRLLAMASRAQ